MNSVELTNAILIHLGKLADKWADRDELTDGSAYEIHGHCAGSIDGHEFSLPIDGTLTVGHESVKATSVTPKQVEIVAAILSKLNTATRVKVVQDVLDEYRETGTVTASEHMIELSDSFLKGLRQSKQEKRRGDVRVNTPCKECEIELAEVA